MRTKKWTGSIAATALIGAMILSSGVQAAATAPTFTEDVAPIFMENCVKCHRPGEMAPMSLISYAEARPWAKSIKAQVVNGVMPPWDASPEFGHFSNDPRLSPKQIDTISSWVDAGAPRGNPDAMPAVPEFTEGWELGEPDYIFELPTVEIPAEGADLFPDHIIRLNIPDKRWVRAVEVRPERREVNHHVVLFMGGGPNMSGGEGGGGNFNVLAVWAVGSPATQYDPGMGRWIEPGQMLIANMHYHPNGKATSDTTRVGIYYGEGELEEEVHSILAGTMNFKIPAGVENHEITASYPITQDIDLISYFPHMHLRGKSMKFVATYPDGDTETLIDVPNYDFNWQMFYYLEEPLRLPKGSKIDIIARYDNSASNPSNPDPSRDVGFGLQSSDEMMFGLFEFTGAAADGEEIVLPTDTDVLSALMQTLPPESTYRIDLAFGAQSFPTALVLPRDESSNAAWHIMFNGQPMRVPLSDLTWTDDHFGFRLELLGGSMGTFDITGDIDGEGEINGKFKQIKTDRENAGGQIPVIPFDSFAGALAGD